MKYIVFLLLIGMVLLCGCTIGGEPITMGGNPVQIPTQSQNNQKSDAPITKTIIIADLDKDIVTNGFSGYGDSIYYVIDNNNSIYSLGVPFYQDDVSRYTLYRSLKRNVSYAIEYQYDKNIKINDITSIALIGEVK